MARDSPRLRYGARAKQTVSERWMEQLRRLLRLSNSRALGKLARNIDTVASWFRPKYLPLTARVLISICQPINPLKRARNLPAINLVVPFVEKDLESLGLVLDHALKNVRNPISRITLITPGGDKPGQGRFSRKESAALLDAVLAAHPQAQLSFDDDVLGMAILKEMEDRFGAGDRNAGWVVQQLIKYSAALQSPEPASLILDADTLLLSSKTWFTRNKVQLLQVANEYHVDFMRHAEKFFGVHKKLRLSYITHHQLMQRDVVQEMFPEGAESLLSWWKSSRDPIGRDLGDYEAYGTFLVARYPERVRFGSFANLFSPHLTRFLSDLETTRKTPAELTPGYCSVSFHSWAQVDRDARASSNKA